MNAVHPLAPEAVMAYLDGEVTAAEARDIQAHLAACGTCQQLAADLREGSGQLREWQVDEPPPTLVAPSPRLPGSVRESLRERSSTLSCRRRKSRRTSWRDRH